MTPEQRNQKAKEFADSVTSRESFSRILTLLASKELDAQLFKEGTNCFLQEAYLQGAVDELMDNIESCRDRDDLIDVAAKL